MDFIWPKHRQLEVNAIFDPKRSVRKPDEKRCKEISLEHIIVILYCNNGPSTVFIRLIPSIIAKKVKIGENSFIVFTYIHVLLVFSFMS